MVGITQRSSLSENLLVKRLHWCLSWLKTARALTGFHVLFLETDCCTPRLTHRV